MSSGILDSLEVGSNVFELIEFSLDRYLENGSVTTGRYGVNVAKVREVVRMPQINPLASSIPGVAGVFELRGIPIPAINLAVALGDAQAPVKPAQQIIVTEFSLKRAGFIVRTTERIRRVAWEKVLPPTADRHTCINGMTLVENNEFLFILDLERILIEIEARGGFHKKNNVQAMQNPSDPDLSGGAPLFQGIGGAGVPTTESGRLSSFESSEETFDRSDSEKTHILLIDDSDIILRNARIYLEKEGYRVSVASNGLMAKGMLEEFVEQGSASDKIDVIVTDVEMPKMDGLTLTKWIKEHPTLSLIPVILHTSLSGNANMESGRIVGANAYVVKNDIQMLLGLIKEIESNKADLSFPD